MPLQNRVAPDGSLHAVAERGMMLGNRGGKFHRDDKTLGKRRWASTHWIACELHYKNWHHEAMGKGYTSLFFLDEVTALSAGHRPCFMCRRQDAKAFLGDEKVGEFDRRLHGERTTKITVIPAKAGTRLSSGDVHEKPRPGLRRDDGIEGVINAFNLVDGAMIEKNGCFLAKRGSLFLRWSFSGYTDAQKNMPSLQAIILTPPSILAILQSGYKPRWHPSAIQWENT